MMYSFIKYNKLIYTLYAFLIMLLFSTYSTTTYCEESLIDEKIKQTTLNNNYTYYILITLFSVTAFCATYAITAYYFPDFDLLNLYTDKDFPSYGLQSLVSDKIIEKQITSIDLENFTDKIVVDKSVFDHLNNSLIKHRQINISLMEDKMLKEVQIKNLYILIDLMSSTPTDTPQSHIRRNSL